ncbi:protein of unknown function [Flavobacterium flevense]|uniref:DUF3784 domain-containing protein n=1 Tax=Flavobacterium flevense TaxID=983 RepID=A0A4Y4AX19_9FLAO|nr:DUF3784 domain-containing protein [Flavobacterium flevense]GEC71672.1 hypothetical protein FFL01_12110 [Flavobacterium flevense]SHL27345.1 protein of unknown function [Flavobacterium flevense]
MMYTLIGMSLLFIAIGFIVNVNNAKYLLAGYNTMSKAEQDQVDLKTYITYFRKFHLFLGFSFFLIGILLKYLLSENAVVIFIGVYPIAAYIYFIATSAKYFKAKKNKVGVFLLAIGLIFIVVMFIRDFKETKLILNSNSIEFKGDYGETVPFEKIKNIQLVDEKPRIVQRINGFSAGTIKKGIYKTDTSEKVKLIINAENKPYILITKLDGKKIYYSAKEASNEQLFQKIKNISNK